MLTRLAPTPSGFIHTGNIFNFLLNWLWARSNNGKVLLRIDDADAERKRDKYIDDIFRVLDWLVLDWDIGPTGPDDFEKNWSQTNRTELYNTILTELAEKNLLFACECSRKNYQCNCAEKNISLSHAGVAWKIKTTGDINIFFTDKNLGSINIDLANSSAFIVKRKDGIPSYQICSLADDRHFGVTHICRGEDLLSSTAMQLYIDKQLNVPYFNHCTFWHHQLITDAAGNKLSKSAGAFEQSSITELIKKEELIAAFARWAGLDEKLSLKEMTGLKLFMPS